MRAGDVMTAERWTERTDGTEKNPARVKDDIEVGRARRMRRDIGTIAGTAGIAVATGEGMLAAILGTWILARNRVEDDYRDRNRSPAADPPEAAGPRP